MQAPTPERAILCIGHSTCCHPERDAENLVERQTPSKPVHARKWCGGCPPRCLYVSVCISSTLLLAFTALAQPRLASKRLLASWLTRRFTPTSASALRYKSVLTAGGTCSIILIRVRASVGVRRLSTLGRNNLHSAFGMVADVR